MNRHQVLATIIRRGGRSLCMKRYILSAIAVMLLGIASHTTAQTGPLPVEGLPVAIPSGPFKAGHIQGIAIDAERRFIYCSYTTILVKMDFEGNVMGSVTGLLGHLGDLDFHKADGRVYGSLEYKNDAIGRGIMQMENCMRKLDNAFYIAIFDVDKINRLGMDAEKDGIMTTVYLPTVLDDYLATVEVDGKSHEHRLGCSGIDGVSFGPELGRTRGKEFLTVGYGIYSDPSRSDNDYQVLLQYDVSDWKKYEKTLSQEEMHTQGPQKPDGQYFVFTGNTTYGVQNLEYDAHSRKWWMAVYKGNKPQYANYSLFAMDASAKPRKQSLKGVPYIRKADAVSQVQGWMQNVGSTGICSLDNGCFYISHSSKTEKGQGSTLRLYRYTSGERPFKEVE